MNLHHTNIGPCPKCEEIFSRFPGFDSELKAWFIMFRAKYREFHISCAGRGRIDQESLFQRKASNAHYGESAHNYNCAIDTFINLPGDIYDLDHYNKTLALDVPDWITWYGKPGSEYWELPHLERSDWKELKNQGKIKLVE